jgi:hypothetical protein
MTERYGYGDRYRDEPGGGERPSGRGAVAERRAGQDEEVREIDLTDEAIDREEAAAREAEEERATVDAAAAAPGAEAGEPLPRSDREASGAFEPHPVAAAPTAATTSIFDVGRDEAAAPGPPEPATDEVAADEAATHEVATDEVATDEAATDEAATDEPATHEVAADEAAPDEAAPDEVATDEPAAPAALLASLDAESIRSRFLDIQAGFVDEPRQAVEEAGRFIDELVQQVIDALQAQRGQLQAPMADDASTEDLRLSLRAYRQFVDRLLGLAP